jgi:hypothetical protein
MVTCACGNPIPARRMVRGAVVATSAAQCRPCYLREYAREHRPAPKPKPPRLGTTPETATPCTYMAAHLRVHRTRGVASTHTCVACGAGADEWAYRGDSPHEIRGEHTKRGRQGQAHTVQTAWSPLVWDYDPMCTACHLVKDRGRVADSQFERW